MLFRHAGLPVHNGEHSQFIGEPSNRLRVFFCEKANSPFTYCLKAEGETGLPFYANYGILRKQLGIRKGRTETMVYEFRPQGVCSQAMRVELDEQNIIQKMDVYGGCSGNLQGISRLVVGMRAEDAIARLKGIRCGMKPTSCPDQLAQALKAVRDNG